MKRTILRWGLITTLLLTLASLAGPATHTVDAAGSLKTYLPILYSRFGPGTLTGTVFDTLPVVRDGVPVRQPIAGAQVCSSTGTCASTDANGRYTLNNVTSGDFTVSADGYYTVQTFVQILFLKTVEQNFVLSASLSLDPGEIPSHILQVVLTWNGTEKWTPDNWENDLDAHMWIEAHTGLLPFNYFADYPGDCAAAFPNGCLRFDYRKGFGPETFDIVKYIDNSTYYFGVLNYNQGRPGVPDLADLGATVQIYDGSGLYKTITIPKVGTGDFWYVFSFDGQVMANSGSLDQALTMHNCIVPAPGTILDENGDPSVLTCQAPQQTVAKPRLSR